MKIEFIDLERYGQGCLQPIPAAKEIPRWYKKLPALRRLYHPNNPQEQPDYTAKKCIPLLDAFTTGYYLVTKYDSVWSLDKNGNHLCECPAELVSGGGKPITMHPWEQLRGMDVGDVYNEYAYKFSNPYVIKTPPGYSCLFTHPFNQISPFLTLTGVVDTDMHPIAIQFPFLMLKDFKGTIKANTPIVQVIPFKRDDWEFSIPEPTKLDMQEISLRQSEFHSSRYDDKGNASGGEYKKKYRLKKKYL
jgi:hypothetical protein